MLQHNGLDAAILIVEDDANELHVMRDYLSRAGFKVRTAANGWDALKRVKDGPVDLLISELTISDMDSGSLREKLVLNPATRDIPFLFLVPEEKTDILVRALRSGVDDCITKPFDPVVLVARVQAVIERRLAYEQMVRIDPLTRMLNRPSMNAEMLDELSRVERYERFGTMVIIDIDGFADINTDGGVATGDLLLTCLAGVILNTVRNIDLAGRTRAEAFLLYLPETDLDGAMILTERIQNQLAKIAEALLGQSLTFSCGIVASPQHGVTLDVLRPCLEKALAHAKETDKGGIAVWGRDVNDETPEE